MKTSSKTRARSTFFYCLDRCSRWLAGLNNVGFLNFIGNAAKNFLEHANLDPLIALLFIIAFFYLLHYLFASITAHVSALFALFVGLVRTFKGSICKN